MSTKYLTSTSLMALLVVATTIGSTAQAQTYTRTELAGTYAERAGDGIETGPIIVGTSRAAEVVKLPFAFPYFDRTYTQLWARGDGVITFRSGGVSLFNFGLATLVSEPVPSAREAIIAFRPQNSMRASFQVRDAVTAHAEEGRVVIQWKHAVAISGTGLVLHNLQVHLRADGTIEMHYGPEEEFEPSDVLFVSGIVDESGTQRVAGFGNTLDGQTTRPAAGTIVRYQLSGATPVDGIELVSGAGNDEIRSSLATDNIDTVYETFVATPVGNGGTLQSITIDTEGIFLGTDLVFDLYRDNEPYGVLDATDVRIGSAPSNGADPITIGGISELIRAAEQPYLVAVDDSALQAPLSTEDSTNQLTGAGDVPVWGGAATNARVILNEVPVFLNLGEQLTLLAPILNGSTDNAIMSFEMRQGAHIERGEQELYFDTGTDVTVTQMAVELGVNGDADISHVTEVRLVRDLGTIGALDDADVLIGTVTAPTNELIIFTGLSEQSSNAGVDYLVLVDTGNSLVGTADIEGDIQEDEFVATEGAEFDTEANGDTSDYPMVGSDPQVIVRPRTDIGFLEVPVAPGTTDQPALAITLNTQSGTAQVSEISLNGTVAVYSEIRIFEDAGTPGRLDGDDTLIAIAAADGSLDFVNLALAITQEERHFLVVVDVDAAAPLGRFTLTLDTVTANVPSFLPVTINEQLAIVDPLAVDGVTITALSLQSEVRLGGEDAGLVAALTLVPRGNGGNVPELEVDVLFGAGGVGVNSGMNTLIAVEGSGPIGQLDPTDRFIPSPQEENIDSADDIDLLPYSVMTRPVSVLVFIWRGDSPVDGTATLVWTGLDNANDTILEADIPASGLVNATIINESVAGADNNGGDGGCSYGSGGSLTLPGIMLLLAVGLFGLRRRGAVIA